MKYCNNCGKKVTPTAEFCGSCGGKVSGEEKRITGKTDKSKVEFYTEEEFKELLEGKKKKKTGGLQNALEKSLSWVAGIAAYLIGRFLGLIVLMVIFIPAGIGAWLANYYMKSKQKFNDKVKYFMYLNFVSWLFPIAGFFTSFATITMGGRIKDKKTSRNWQTIGWVALTASFFNSLVGYLQAL